MCFFLKKINYQLGSIYDVETLKEDTEYVNYLKSVGLNFYSKSDCNEFELVYKAAKKTLFNQEKPQFVIYSSDSLDNHENQKDDFSKLMCDLEISNIYPIGQFLNRCSNFSSCLVNAINLLKTNLNIKSVLIMLSDKIYPHQNRLSPLNYVASDSAASVIISREKTPECFEILNAMEYADHSMVYIDPQKQLIPFIKKTEEAIRKVTQSHLDKINLKRNEFIKFICGNYNLTIMENYLKISGFDQSQLYTELLSRYGHTFSSNSLICLKKIIPQLKNNDKLFLLTTGDIFFGSISLKFFK